MKVLNALLLSLSLYLVRVPVCNAQNSEIWFQYYSTYSLNKNLSVKTDVSLRSVQNRSHWNSVLVRSGVNYLLTKRVQTALALAYLRNGQTHTHENRIHLELTERSKILNNVRWINRIRSEGRFFEDKSTEVVQKRFKLRTRLKSQLTVPINSKKIRAKTIYGTLSDEIFIHHAGDFDSEFFDKNRFLVGLGYSIISNMKIGFNYVFENSYAPRLDDKINTRLLWFTIHHKF